MNFFTKWPLRITMPLFLFLAATILLIFSTQLDLSIDTKLIEEQGVSELTQDMTLIQGVLDNLFRKGDIEGVQAIMADFGAKTHVRFVILLDKRNYILYSSDKRLLDRGAREALPDVDMQALSNIRRNVRGVVYLSKSADFISGYYPVVINAQLEGVNPLSRGILYVCYDLKVIKSEFKYEILTRLFGNIFYYAIVFVFLYILLFIIVTKRASLLVLAAKKIAAGDLTARANIEGRDELSIVATSFNNMVEQIAIKQGALIKSEENLELTVEKRTAELVLARDLAENANRSKSIFLSNMSHEIRTPMNAVLGFAQLLENDSSLSQEGHEMVDTIIKSGEHLLSIINDILEMSCIEVGKIELHNEAVDLYNLLNELANMFRLLAGKKGLYFNLELAEDLPRYVEIDKGKLRQILINLLGNAVKFTKKGSIIMNAFTQNNRIAIEVRDTGIGIKPEETERIFHPFERTRSGSEQAGGSGLGLAISNEYAHIMGGKIGIESQLNEGSSFRFEFNALIAPVVSHSLDIFSQVTALSPGQGEIRILIVDDQSINRKLLRRLLEPIGFIVDEANDGEEAISKAKSNLPRIILMDKIMPGMNGIDATKILRNICADKSLTIIGISAGVFAEEKQQFIDAGLNTFIAKPVNKKELFDALASHAGVLFETEAINKNAPKIPVVIDKETLEKVPQVWREALTQALANGSISRIRNLGEEAKVFDCQLADWMLEQVALYDLDSLKNFFHPR